MDVNQMIIHFSAAFIPPSACSSIHPFLRILNLVPQPAAMIFAFSTVFDGGKGLFLYHRIFFIKDLRVHVANVVFTVGPLDFANCRLIIHYNKRLFPISAQKKRTFWHLGHELKLLKLLRFKRGNLSRHTYFKNIYYNYL